MCGRYYIDDDTAREIDKLVRQVDERLHREQLDRDIYPTNHAPILIQKRDGLEVSWHRWGFPAPQGKGVLFNARSETALEKRSFKDSILNRRCIVPAACFYEWNKSKEKYTFFRNDKQILFMAGFFKQFEDGSRFVILTTQANQSVSPVHDRMPLILEKDELEEYLMEESKLKAILSKEPVYLTKKTDYEQQSLF